MHVMDTYSQEYLLSNRFVGWSLTSLSAQIWYIRDDFKAITTLQYVPIYSSKLSLPSLSLSISSRVSYNTIHKTSGQNNLTKGRIAGTHGR